MTAGALGQLLPPNRAHDTAGGDEHHTEHCRHEHHESSREAIALDEAERDAERGGHQEKGLRYSHVDSLDLRIGRVQMQISPCACGTDALNGQTGVAAGLTYLTGTLRAA